MLVPNQILPMAPRWRARMTLKLNQVAPEGGEEEEGPVDGLTQPREVKQLMEVKGEEREV